MNSAETVIVDAVTATPASLVEVQSMAKAFGPTKALQDCSFQLLSGEIHALVGENGSGKSTLVKILNGVQVPDRGTITFGDGKVVTAIHSPREAQNLGIATVFQEVLVSPARSVLDNVWIGADTLLRSRVPVAEKRKRASAALQELLDWALPLDTIVEDLSLSDRQAISIVRALLRNPRILILDEATSALDCATRDRLFDIVRRLAADGVGIILITHRLDEIQQIGDRVTVLRSGVTVGTVKHGAWTPQTLVGLMTGSDRAGSSSREGEGRSDSRIGDVVLSARSIKLRADAKPFDVEIHAGELVGVAGLEGQGQAKFLRALWGDSSTEGQVVRRTSKGDTRIRNSSDAAAQGIAYVPRERGLDSLFAWMSIRENFAMPTLSYDRVGGLISHRRSRSRLKEYGKQLSVVMGDANDAITTLSGGNQQKVVIARWLAARPKILLLNDPTRGVDINAKRDLYQLLLRLTEEGVAVVMLSTEVSEHVELMDRVLVFREGELWTEIPRAALTGDLLVACYFGEKAGGDGGSV